MTAEEVTALRVDATNVIHNVKQGIAPSVSSLPNSSEDQASKKHFGDWPNDVAFNSYHEQQTPVALNVVGHIPAWAAGTLLRTGPGSYKAPPLSKKDKGITLDHWFDGFTRLHKFKLAPDASTNGGCKVSYQSRNQVDKLIENARRNGKFTDISFGQKRDPCDTLYQKIKSAFKHPSTPGEVAENTGVTFRVIPGEPLSAEGVPKTMNLATDAHFTKKFVVETLEPLGVATQATLHPDLKGNLSAAHAAFDPETGDCYNFNLALGPKQVYRVFCTKADGSGTNIIATIHGFRGAYIHSFFMTKHFVILCIWPCYMAAGGVKVLWDRNFVDSLGFDKTQKCQWLVIDRTGKHGVVARFETQAMFSFHTINAWEEEVESESATRGTKTVKIMAELCEFEDIGILHNLYYKNLVSNGPGVVEYQKERTWVNAPSLVRYELGNIRLDTPPATKDAKSLRVSEAVRVVKVLPPDAGDLPRINPAYVGRQHRYVYCIINRGLSSFVDALGKADTNTGETKLWSVKNHTPGEPIFLARPGSVDEDDGVVLSVIFNGDKGTSYLVCLDAKTMEELGRAECENPVGLGFHGVHLPLTQNA